MEAQTMLVKNSNSLQQKCKKFYLDQLTTDVKFVFKDDDETVPAHKILLSASSTVFHTMFYGASPEKDDILIEDATPGVFKEFLQFFYLDEFQLTSENIFPVANLCKKFEVNDALKLCEAPMLNSFTINNMCTGYAKVKLLEMENVIKYCEQQIKHKASDVLKSNDFMECNDRLLDEILQLVSSECGASDIVDACMVWAKTKCERENLEATSGNLKVQLKSSFDRIPFAELDSHQFSQHTKTYKRFFVEDELEAMLLKTMSKRPKMSEPMSDSEPMLRSHMLDCDRRMDLFISIETTYLHLEVSFSSNTKLLLKEFYIDIIIHFCNATITLHNNQSEKSLNLGTVTLGGIKHVPFVIPFPVFIDQDVKYTLKIDCDVKRLPGTWTSKKLADCVTFENGVEIRFDDASKIIPRIIFQRLAILE